MKAYQEYKETGLDWLGTVPKHWELNKISSLFSERKEKVSDKDYAPLSVTKQGIVPQLSSAAKSDDGDNRKKVLNGDFVINSRSDRKGSSGVSLLDGSVSLINLVLTPRINASLHYLHYLLKSSSFIEEYYRNGRGIVADLWTTRFSEMKTIYLPTPPREEQDQIVKFLDYKISKINKFIKNKKRLIELLNEQKQAVINQAVTKGLNPNVEMKDSGIDWLGEVPKHWEVIRCKHLFKERNERSSMGLEVHLSMSQKYGLIPDSQLDERRMLSASYAGGKICHKNDIVLNRLKAHLGVFALANLTGVISPDYTVLIVDSSKLHPKYAELLLKSNSLRKELKVRVRGVVEGFWRLYTEDFNSIFFPLFSLEEQEEIVNYISKEEGVVCEIIAKIQKEIDLIQEYKTSLISSVVTGQVDVRDIVVLHFTSEENFDIDESIENFVEEGDVE